MLLLFTFDQNSFTANFKQMSAHIALTSNALAGLNKARWIECLPHRLLFRREVTTWSMTFRASDDSLSCDLAGLNQFWFSWRTCCDSTSFSTKTLPTSLFPVSCLHIRSKLQQSIVWAGRGGAVTMDSSIWCFLRLWMKHKTLAIALNCRKLY